jgi:simple sugar transport system permease protein
MNSLRRVFNAVAGPIVAALIAFGVGAVLIVLTGADPVLAYRALWQGAFGSVRAITETLLKASPLLLVGLSMTVAYRCSFWNIGGEGQLQMGALAAAAFGMVVGAFPSWAGIPATLAVGFLAGAAWCLIPAFLKAKFCVNEVISTLLLNYSALLFVEYMAKNVIGDPNSFGWGVTPFIASSAELPIIIADTRLHAGFILALICAVLVFLLLWRTTSGYKVRAVGLNPVAAAVGGINVDRSLLLAAFISGGLSGLAGVGEVAGIHHRLIVGFSPGYGYTGMIIALLGRLHPVGVIIAAILFGGLTVGADTMSRTAGIDIALIDMIAGLIILLVIAGQLLARKVGMVWKASST